MPTSCQVKRCTHNDARSTLAELGGHEVGDTEHMVTETLIRGMYRYWRKVMEA